MTEYNGIARLAEPATNKSTAFTREEREAFGARGLLSCAVFDMETQKRRVLANMRRKASPKDDNA